MLEIFPVPVKWYAVYGLVMKTQKRCSNVVSKLFLVYFKLCIFALALPYAG